MRPARKARRGRIPEYATDEQRRVRDAAPAECNRTSGRPGNGERLHEGFRIEGSSRAPLLSAEANRGARTPREAATTGEWHLICCAVRSHARYLRDADIAISPTTQEAACDERVEEVSGGGAGRYGCDWTRAPARGTYPAASAPTHLCTADGARRQHVPPCEEADVHR